MSNWSSGGDLIHPHGTISKVFPAYPESFLNYRKLLYTSLIVEFLSYKNDSGQAGMTGDGESAVLNIVLPHTF